jgi:hypothetical protein
MEKKANTSSGLAWLEKYLHPPSANNSIISGIPDRSTNNSAVINWSNETLITPPTTVTTGTWSCLVISTPCPSTPGIFIKWAGADPVTVAQVTTGILPNTSFQFGTNDQNWRTAVGQYRPCAFSLTTYSDVSDLYNQGMVHCCQSALSTNENTGIGTNPVQVIQNNDIGKLPLTPGEIIQASPRYYSGKAKDGCFAVHALTNPTTPFLTSDPNLQTLTGFILPNQLQQLRIDMSNGATLTAPTDQPSENSTIMYNGMSVSYTLYTGLLAQATIVAKSCHTWEILVQPSSVWIPFVTPGAEPDPLALDSAAFARYHMQDGAPAAANDLGSLWEGLKSFFAPLGKAWNLVKGPAKMGINMLPGGSLINSGIDLIEGFTNMGGSPSKKNTNTKTKVIPSLPKPKPKVKAKKKKIP